MTRTDALSCFVVCANLNCSTNTDLLCDLLCLAAFYTNCPDAALAVAIMMPNENQETKATNRAGWIVYI